MHPTKPLNVPPVISPELVTGPVIVPPVIVPLLVTGPKKEVLPASNVPFSATTTLLIWACLMVSGASASSSSRSTLPVMVSSPLVLSNATLLNVPPVTVASPMFFTVALVKSPPVMEPVLVFSTVPVMVPPVIVPKFKRDVSPEICTFAELVISPSARRYKYPYTVISPSEMVPPMLHDPPSAMRMSPEKFEFRVRVRLASATISMLSTLPKEGISLLFTLPVTVSLPSSESV